MGVNAKIFGNALKVIGLRIQVHSFEEFNDGVQESIVAIARDHMRGAGYVGKLGIGQLADEAFGGFARDQFAQPPANEGTMRICGAPRDEWKSAR